MNFSYIQFKNENVFFEVFNNIIGSSRHQEADYRYTKNTHHVVFYSKQADDVSLVLFCIYSVLMNEPV